MRIVIGLGNPGREYARTRHNIGFMVVERMAKRIGADRGRARFRSQIAEGSFAHQQIVLVQPQTYMNLSGHALREIVNWYRVDLEDVLVVFDDMDLPFGSLRLRPSGSAGGHNGLRSIVEQLGTTTVPRLRLGIGRGRSSAVGQVLSRFSPEEERHLPEVIDEAVDAITCWVEHGIVPCMNNVNRRSPASDVAGDRTGQPEGAVGSRTVGQTKGQA